MNNLSPSSDEKGKDLAERIAELIKRESGSSTIDEIHRSIDDLNLRIQRLELQDPRATKTAPAHPSQDRFEIAEAIVDRLFEKQSGEKACVFEPRGKPCDHCSMCSSRGF